MCQCHDISVYVENSIISSFHLLYLSQEIKRLLYILKCSIFFFKYYFH